MTTAPLCVPRTPPLPSPKAWFKLAGPPLGFVGSDVVASAVYYNGVTYLGVIDGNGNARVIAYDNSTEAVTVSPAVVTGLGADIHCTPSVLVRSSDQRILLAVSPHSTAHMYIAVSTNAEDVTAWGAATDIESTLGGTAYTYAHLVQLSGESGKIYLFYRDAQSTTGVLAYSTSTDGGSTWAAQTALYKNAGEGSYWVIGSDGASRIDFAVSDGNASSGFTASLYHFYYEGGSYYTSDGMVIGASLPLAPSSLTKLYDGATDGSVRVPYSIVQNSGSPILAWAAYNTAGSGSDENYWYGTYSSGWTVNKIDTSGSTPNPNFAEGGVALDRIDPTRVYVSRFDSTSENWQMYLYQTTDGGSTWDGSALSNDPALGAGNDAFNLRAISPLGAVDSLRTVWCFGPHYALESVGNGAEPPATWLRGYPNPIGSF